MGTAREYTLHAFKYNILVMYKTNSVQAGYEQITRLTISIEISESV